MPDDLTAFVTARLATEEEFLRIAKLGAKTAQRMRHEIDAKRMTLDEHSPPPKESGPLTCMVCHAGGWDYEPEKWPCQTARALASFWALDPGYRQEWAPAPATLAP